MSTTDQPPKPKRRRYQFSLLTLLVVMTVAIVVFGGWVQYRRQRAEVNRDRFAAVEKAVAAIEDLGGTVLYLSEQWPQTWLEAQFDDPGGSDHPSGVLTVTEVVLYADLDDTTVEHLTTLKNLKVLTLVGRQVMDEDDFKKLRQALPNCVFVHLY